MDEVTKPVPVPIEALSAEAQEGVIDDFIQREGTDYGVNEASLEKKRADIRRQIEKGLVKLVFDAESDSITLLTAHEFKKLI